MIVFQKILSSWMMPSGILIIFLLFLGFTFRKQRKFLSFFILTITIVVYLLNTGIGTYIFVKPLETYYSQPNLATYSRIDVVITLGGGIVFGPNNVYLNAHALQRLYEGILLAKKLDIPMIITGGESSGRKKMPEALVMKKVVEDMGIKLKGIIVEPNAKNTYENALYTSKICKEKGFENLLVVTSAVHMKRAIKCFKLFDIKKIIPYPTDYRYDYSKLSWVDFIPSSEAFDANMAAVHELVGILWYSIRYNDG